MPAARSSLLAAVALFLWSTVGALAFDTCACPDDSSCEHAGRECTQPGDCSDCLVPCAHAVPADEPVAAPSFAKLTSVAVTLTVRITLLPLRDVFVGTRLSSPLAMPPLRPPALRSGALALRI